MIPFSILDLAPINEGSDAVQSFRNTLSLAQQGERFGYQRYWLAEHHGMPGIASAATALLIGHVAGGTSTIRVGAGGIMLPNHSPLVIAEQFGTLASLFPGRIDLGLGRAPGSDMATARALRRNLTRDADQFPQDVVELMDYFADNGRQPVRAVPGAGLKVPVWILGSSLFGAQLAAALGLPYAFASHFAPDTDVQAEFLASSMQQAFINLRSGHPRRLQAPLKGYMGSIGAQERALLSQILSCAAIGSRDKIKRELQAFIAQTGADELMITSQIFDHAARLRSYEITAEVRDEL